MKAELKRDDLIYPDLSYQIVGCAYDVFKQLGPGLLEKSYQKAMTIVLRKNGLQFKEQVKFELKYEGEKVGAGYFDFLVEEKIIVELKRGRFFFAAEIDQVSQYLKMSDKKFGLIIRFTDEGARFKRVLNINSEDVVISEKENTEESLS